MAAEDGDQQYATLDRAALAGIDQHKLIKTIRVADDGTLLIQIDPSAGLPLPTGASTSAKQDTQIALQNASEISRDDLFVLLRTLLYAIRDPIHMDVINNAMRVVLNTNLVSLANTTDLRTITTVSTVTNQTNMGGYPLDQVTVNASETDWALTQRSLMI